MGSIEETQTKCIEALTEELRAMTAGREKARAQRDELRAVVQRLGRFVNEALPESEAKTLALADLAEISAKTEDD